MNTATIDNSIDAVLDKIVIWQYDDSTSICALIDQFKQWFHDTTGSVWDSISKEFNLDNPEDVSDYTLSLMGKILGIPRQNVVVDGETRTMSRELYRRIIVAKFRLLNSNGSFGAYTKFLDEVFGGNVNIENNQDMSVSVEWIGDEPSTDDEKELKYAFDNYRKYIFTYPTGVEEQGEITGLRFWLAETHSQTPAEGSNGGGLDESSFDWTNQNRSNQQ